MSKLGWAFDTAKGIITIPPNPDNQIESTVVQESIKLPRTCLIGLVDASANCDLLIRVGQGYFTCCTSSVSSVVSSRNCRSV